MGGPRRNRPLLAAGVVAALVLPVAVAVGEGAVWALLAGNTLLRVDPGAHRVTGSLELGRRAGPVAGPLAVGAGAVWVGAGSPGRVLRVEPAGLRVTMTWRGSVAEARDGTLWSVCCGGGSGPLRVDRVDARTLRPRPPLALGDRAGGPRQAVRLAVGPEAVWVQGTEPGRVWRVPLPGGPARPVPLPGTVYGLAAGAGAAWVLTGAADPGDRPDPSARLRRLDAGSGAVTAVGPLPDLVTGLATGPVVGGGAVWLVGPSADLRLGGSTLVRVDPASAGVTAWLRSELALANVLAAGPGGAWVATGRPDLLHVVPA